MAKTNEMPATALKPPRQKGVWKDFWALMRGVKLPWIWLALVLLFNLFWAQLTLMIPDATADIVAGDLRATTIITFVVLLFVQTLVSGVQSIVNSIANYKVDLNFQRFVLKKIMRLPVAFYDKNKADELISRTTDDTTTMRSFLVQDLLAIPSNIYTLVGVLAALFLNDWRLVVLGLLMSALTFVVPIITARISFRWNDLMQGKLSGLTGYLAEGLQNIPLTKVFVQEAREIRKGLKVIKELYDTRIKYLFISSGLGVLSSAQEMVSLLLNVLGGVYLINAGYITLDMWIEFYMFSNTLTGAIAALFPQLWVSIKGVQGSTRRISEIAAEPDETKGGSLDLRTQGGDIAFDHVSFGYAGGPEVLQDLSFTIPQGKTTAIIGRSGEGKSTLYGLLERFYQPKDGKITVGGQDIDAYNMHTWRKAVGYVSQNTNLLSGTVRDNIVYGVDRDVSQEEIENVAKLANAYDFIQDLENGFDTEVGLNGSKLSGGQRQRICIARELLKDPALLLLDEATSSLDMEAEYQVTQALNRLREGRTTLMVSHRLRSVTDADQIVYLADHKVAGTGTHESLLKENASYRSLIEAQLEDAV